MNIICNNNISINNVHRIVNITDQTIVSQN